MEPAVRSPRTESAIITDRAQNGDFGLPRLPYSRLPKGIGRGNPGAGNGIFGCRDGRLKIGLRDRKCHQRPKERNDTGENPRRNGLFGADPEIIWTKLAAPHAVIETSLRNSRQERNFLLQRPGGETGSFGSIAGAETALTREFGRHVFEIAALLRVSQG